MKTTAASKSTKTPKNNHPCPCCEEGHMVLRKLGFKTELEGKAVTIPKVEMERCDSCGETFLTPAGSCYVDDWLDEKSETITTEELQKFLTQYHLTQKQAAEILKIGEKNFSRWLNGRQRVSASMSNYIRTLTAVPEAFKTLRKKQWK